MGRKKKSTRCPDCGSTFSSAAGLEQHVLDSHPAQSSDGVLCPYCRASFPSLNDLKRHKTSSHGWKCTKCPGFPPFEDGAAWQAHFTAVHSASAEPHDVTAEGREKPAATHAGGPDDQHHAANNDTQVKAQPEPISNQSTSDETVVCEHCLDSFTSSKSLKQHKATFHSWKCLKCPGLPPFADGVAWQTHFNEVHAAGVQSGQVKDTKGKGVATPINEGKINDRYPGGNRDTDTKAQGAATQPKPHPSSFPHVNASTINSKTSEAQTPSVHEVEVASSVSGDKSGFLTPKAEPQLAHHTTPSLGDPTASFDERDHSQSKGPILNLLVEIDPEPRRSRDEMAYDIASDVWSPTMTVSSIGVDGPEEEHDIDMSPSHSLELLNGSSSQNGSHIIVPPRVPILGNRESRTLSGAIVTGSHSRGEPNVPEEDGLDGVTPSPTNLEQYDRVGSGSPASTSYSSRDENQGDLPHDPLRGRRSKPGLREVHFECRICFSDPTPTTNLTTTICGHLFCYECIAAEVLRTSRCPVCKNVLALYCLFKLDVAS